MYNIDIFTSRNYHELDGKFQNELIRKIQRLTNASFSAIEDALSNTRPMVDYCKEFPELTRIAWYSIGETFEYIQNNERKEREKLVKTITDK